VLAAVKPFRYALMLICDGRVEQAKKAKKHLAEFAVSRY